MLASIEALRSPTMRHVMIAVDTIGVIALFVGAFIVGPMIDGHRARQEEARKAAAERGQAPE